MDIFGVDIKLNRSSSFVLQGTDRVKDCKFRISNEGIGTDTPIVLDDESAFYDNLVISEIDYPILARSPRVLINNNAFEMICPNPQS